MKATKYLVSLLKPRYALTKRGPAIAKKAKDFLDPLILPKVYAQSGQGIHIKTTLPAYQGDVLDFCGQTVTCLLGQNDPWVTANIAAFIQSGRPSFLSTTMGQDIYYSVAKRIKELTRMGADSFVNHRLNNGSDATDFAINLAYNYHKRDKKRTTLIAFKGSYHGQGHMLYGISQLEDHLSFFSKVNVFFLDAPDHCENIDRERSLSAHERRILKQLKKVAKRSFAVIVEPIQVNNNGNTLSPTFLRRLRATCNSLDLPLIYDEIQTAWGWLGTMTAAERYGVWPDILAVSKALTAGYGPLSAVIAKNKFKNVGAFGARTNGSDVRSLVAASAVMERLLGTRHVPSRIKRTRLGKELQEGLLSRFPQLRDALYTHLTALRDYVNAAKGRVRIGQIRGDGLLRLIEITDKRGRHNSMLTQKLQHHLLTKGGVFVRLPSNHNDMHTLIVKLPIITSASELAEGFRRMEQSIINFGKR